MFPNLYTLESFPTGRCNVPVLHTEIAASSLGSVLYGVSNPGNTISVFTTRELTAPELTTLDSLIGVHTCAYTIRSTNNWNVCTELDSVTSITTTSKNYIPVDNLSSTPPAGKYLVSFSASGRIASARNTGYFAIAVDGVSISNSERTIDVSANGAICNLHTQTIVTVNGTQSVDVVFKITSSSFTIDNRNLILKKL